MYFEEFREGTVYRLEPIQVSREDIIQFAQQYDPQRIHIDEGFSVEGPFGGLIASGYHTLAVVWSRWAEANVMGDQSMGGPGLDTVQWLAPVRPGDTLYTTVTIMETRPSTSKPRGIIRFRFEVENQEAVPIMVTEGAALIRLRPA